MKTPKIQYTFALGRRIKELLENNPSWGYEELAKELNIPRNRISGVANYFGVKIRELRHKQIIEDYQAGLTYDELKNKYGFSKTHIYRILDKAGLTKKRKKFYRGFEKKLKEFSYSLTKLAEYYKADYRTLKKIAIKKGLYDLVLENKSKRAKDVKQRFYEFMQGRPIPRKNKYEFYRKVADYLDAGFHTVRKIARQYEKELENVRESA